jgi:chromosome segregation ATPase
MSGYAERIAELARKVTGIDLRLKSIDEQRRANAIEASQHGETALQKIAALDAEADQLSKSKFTLTLAADQLDAQLREEEAAAAAAVKKQQAARVKDIGSAIVTLNHEVDAHLNQLREMLQRREQLVNELHRAPGSTIDSRMAFRLAGRESTTAAAAHAGLRRWIALELVPHASVRPMASQNERLPHHDQPSQH